MRRAVAVLMVLALLGAGTGWWLTSPEALAEDALDGLTGEAERGEAVFWAGGCSSCHMAPESEDRLILAGGERFVTAFGTFIAPNISPSEAGIGGWSERDFVQAMQLGVSPEGQHYYPAFPYPSYALATTQDMLDLFAFLQTLPGDDTASAAHELGFPFNIRRSVGGWKLLFLRDGFEVAGDLSPEATRGRYLAEALAHCGECHTARGVLGQPLRSAWLGGAPNPVGDGSIPNITPAGLNWSERDIAAYLRDGFTPEFDSAGGEMASVIRNLANLSEDDHAALAAYLQVVTPVE